MSDKILILGDIHGRVIWKEIIEKENPDKIIFLGDYVSTHSKNITNEQQISNLKDILDYKKENSNKVVLLRGNLRKSYYICICLILYYIQIFYVQNLPNE